MIKSDTTTGLCVLILGLILWLLLIPNGTETGDAGGIEPDTLPNYLAWCLIALGAVLVVRPTDHVVKTNGELFKFGLFFGILAVGLWAIWTFGFLYVSPFLVLALMLATGERRAIWLAIGVVGITSVIWVAVVWLLDRALPGGTFG